MHQVRCKIQHLDEKAKNILSVSFLNLSKTQIFSNNVWKALLTEMSKMVYKLNFHAEMLEKIESCQV